jgi:hypothetical protein
MQRSIRNEARLLRHTKSYAPKIVKRKPSPSEGSEGDIAIGNTPKGVKLYAKIGNKWYSFSSDEQALNAVKDNINVPTANQYNISNLTEDRTYNANSSTTAELADILGTLIKDLERLGFLKSEIS